MSLVPFITGTSRSGTGTMRQLLMVVGNCWITPETHYFADLRRRLGAPHKPLSGTDREVVRRYFLEIAESGYRRTGIAQPVELDSARWIRRSEEMGGSADSFFRAFLETTAPEGRLWGEKTPRHCYHLPEIAELFPEGRFIHMVRDPRAVLASYKKWTAREMSADTDPDLAADWSRKKRSYDPFFVALLWRSATAAARRAASLLGPERIRLQSYEQLCVDPEGEVQALFDWLSIERKGDLSEMLQTHSSHGEDRARAGISTSSLEVWKDILTERELSTVESLVGKEMQAVGYELSTRPRVVTSCLAGLRAAPRLVPAVMSNRHRVGSLPRFIFERLRK